MIIKNIREKELSMIDISNNLGIHWSTLKAKINNPELFSMEELEFLHKNDLIDTI